MTEPVWSRKPPTDAELSTIDQLWIDTTCSDWAVKEIKDARRPYYVIMALSDVEWCMKSIGSFTYQSDADFIVYAYHVVPRLVREIRQLRAELAQLKEKQG